MIYFFTDILKLHSRHLSFVAQKCLTIKGRLDTAPKYAKDGGTIQGNYLISEITN